MHCRQKKNNKPCMSVPTKRRIMDLKYEWIRLTLLQAKRIYRYVTNAGPEIPALIKAASDHQQTFNTDEDYGPWTMETWWKLWALCCACSSCGTSSSPHTTSSGIPRLERTASEGALAPESPCATRSQPGPYGQLILPPKPFFPRFLFRVEPAFCCSV